DEDRQYRQTLLVLTNRRFLSQSLSSESQAWNLSDIDHIKTKDRSGLGTLELLGTDRRLAIWHYTIAHGPAALVLCDRSDDKKSQRPKTPGHAEEDAPEAEEPEERVNTGALLRLYEFARPHLKWIVIACLLSITAAVAEAMAIEIIRPLTNLLRNAAD